MPRDATKIRSRETGFEVCNHTCKATCINKGSHSIIWAKEGNSCVRHARRMDLHPGCQDPCPASAGIFVRNTNPGELGEAIKSMLDARWSEATIDAYFAKNIVDWKQGRSNWPPLQVAIDDIMDVDDVPQAGPSNQQKMDVDDEMDDRGDDVESDGVMDLPPIATMRASTSQTTSRSASIARSAVSSVVSHVNPFLYSLEPHAPYRVWGNKNYKCQTKYYIE
ncbi:hypothetical protein V8E55_005178 [Tylopilus felleus]